MLTSLQRLDVFDNSLSSGQCTMCVLDVLCNCSILKILDLSLNNFNGNLSSEIGNLSPRLSQLALSRKNINGKLLGEIGNLTGLLTLGLNNNNFLGEIMNALGRLKNLQLLDLSSNEF